VAPYSPEGHVTLEKLTITTAPLELRGRVALHDVRLKPPERETVVLRGALEGVGSGVRSSGLEAAAGDQRVGLDVEVFDLAASPRYRIRAGTEQAETNALLAALAGMPDTLYGPLTADAEISGPVGDGRNPVEALAGRARIDIGRGRLRGVSLLRGSFERMGTFGEAALLVGALSGGKTLQRFYGDEFESISGTFRLRDGKARTDDLQMAYRHYTVDLRGSLGLLDERLDLTGTLTIDEEVDAAILEEAQPDAASQRADRKIIPLAHVGGTVRAPRVDLSRDAVLRLAASYAASGRLEKLERKIDERLGEGAGREVMETLEGIFGGKRKKPSDP
jgi:AsmA protein